MAFRTRENLPLFEEKNLQFFEAGKEKLTADKRRGEADYKKRQKMLCRFLSVRIRFCLSAKFVFDRAGRHKSVVNRADQTENEAGD